MAEINIPDSFEGYDLNAFCIPHHYENSLSSVLIPCGLIQDRIERMARDITINIQDSFTALCVLKGGYKFFADLVDKIKQYLRYTDNGRSITISVDFIRLKSRQDDICTGKISVIGLESLESLRNKHVLVVEDIIDTGFTIKKVIDILEEVDPKSITVVSLLLKRTHDSLEYRPDFVGFVIPDRFVVGYALDYNEYFRDLNHICVMNEEGKEEYKNASKK